MKKFHAIALSAALAALALAPSAGARALVTAGSQELGASGLVDFNSEVGTVIDLGARYAWFVADQLSIGGIAGFSDNDYYTSVRFGFVGEYNFLFSDDYRPLFGTDFVPFFGLGLSLAYADSDREDHFAGIISLEPGFKFFLSDDFAFVTSFLANFASEDIYMNDSKASSADLSVRLGMRFYF